MDRSPTRRSLLAMIAAAPALATPERLFAAGKPPSIAELIEQATALPDVSRRIDFIGGSLRGRRYQEHTLIGGPERPERFVVRDDAFDCVTFCEVVLAAAISRDFGRFEVNLRRIRYHNSDVRWRERNHYFADWNRRNTENHICRPVVMQPSVTISKTVTWHGALGRHPVEMVAIPRATFFANTRELKPGDIIGFASRRPNLDFFHTGIVAFDERGKVLLRHASRSRRRVADDDMAAFFQANSVKHVTLVRATDPGES